MKKYAAMVAALSISAFIYLFYRTNQTVINQLFAIVFGVDVYLFLKSFFHANLKLPAQIIYSLPGALWVWVVSISSRDVFIEFKGAKISLVILPLIVALGFELFQYFHWINGHFDWWDVVYSTTFWLFSFISLNKQKRTSNDKHAKFYYNLIFAGSYLIVFFAHVMN